MRVRRRRWTRSARGSERVSLRFMSYDLTIFHDPRLRSFDRATRRLERRRPLKAPDRRRLLALVDDLRAGPLRAEGLSVDPVLDEDRGTLGLCLVGDATATLQAMLPMLQATGMVLWDPQEGVFHYANGGTSREEQAPDGVHEGVGICLRELQADPAPTGGELRDVLDALSQFALADSPDVAAAARLALPVLNRLGEEAEEPMRSGARNTAWDLREELKRRGLPLPSGETPLA